MIELTRREALRGSAAVAAAMSLPMMAAHAGDATPPPEKKLKLLVAGAHPDDPESACGGTIALYTDAGHEVVNFYLTRGEAGIHGKTHEEAARIRSAEAEEACKILGARPLFAGQIDGATEVTAHWYDEVFRLIDAEAPDIVITHWPLDSHRDHRATALLVYDAWLRSKKRFELFYFEVETGRQTQHFWPTHYVDITSVEPRKKKACYAMKSQGAVKGFYVDHTQMHEFRGREAGVDLAEALVRHNSGLTRLPL